MEKLRNAYEFITAGGRLGDPTASQCSDERFETPQGDLCCSHAVTVHFPGVNSIQQVFAALLFYVDNMEIIISERLGHITVRDDYDYIEGSGYNSRIISRDQNGIAVESSVVAFGGLFEKRKGGFVHESCAVVAIDSVDKDELYPYVPSERVRRDISVAIVLTARRRKPKDPPESPREPSSVRTEAPEADDELVVTMRRVAFLKLYNPEFPVSKAALQELHGNIAQWGDVMLQSIRGVLDATH
ncbi:hypothetical protein BBJ28_00013731 [Nothophytophthora sp. Chile5]|nr:hypothetical protein BBJ28_00013731 [Nothophytophthora sp. Chile5]